MTSTLRPLTAQEWTAAKDGNDCPVCRTPAGAPCVPGVRNRRPAALCRTRLELVTGDVTGRPRSRDAAPFTAVADPRSWPEQQTGVV